MKLIYTVKKKTGIEEFTAETGDDPKKNEKVFENIIGITTLAIQNDSTINIDHTADGRKVTVEAKDIVSIKCVDLDKTVRFEK